MTSELRTESSIEIRVKDEVQGLDGRVARFGSKSEGPSVSQQENIQDIEETPEERMLRMLQGGAFTSRTDDTSNLDSRRTMADSKKILNFAEEAFKCK